MMARDFISTMKPDLTKIKMILMDVDGVMTDGKIVFTSAGEELKEFNIKDGMAITMAHMTDLKTGIITGRESQIVQRRAEELKYDVIVQGTTNKIEQYGKIKKQFDLSDEQICYIGDDLPDMAILKKAGFSVTVADAVEDVKNICDFTTICKGGEGAVRETIEKILEAQGKLQTLINQFMQ
jgi:3-deoxy-D-manno-octulosonate 8-phosphate phosphatase (KDO 8-P phosphatase)